MSTPEVGIPYAGSTLIALEAGHFAAIQRCVRLLFALAHSSGYAARVEADAGSDAVLRHAPGNIGVFMGYDFHLTPEGPRLIEVNTNAGGALLNGLHTAALCDPERLACLCTQLVSVESLEQRDRRDLPRGVRGRARQPQRRSRGSRSSTTRPSGSS